MGSEMCIRDRSMDRIIPSTAENPESAPPTKLQNSQSTEFDKIRKLFANVEVEVLNGTKETPQKSVKLRPEALKKIESRLAKADLDQVR